MEKQIVTTTRPVIYHVADIHIRSGVHQDILYAWDQLVAAIRAETVPVILIVAGDVFESKNKLSPLDLACFHQMIRALQDPRITILTIPGNHDVPLGRTGPALDLISAALLGASYPNLHHYTRSGVYPHAGYDFHVLVPTDAARHDQLVRSSEQAMAARGKTGSREGRRPSDGPNSGSGRAQIAIVHEPIAGCKLYGSEHQVEATLTVENLAAFHLVCAGDIHRPQQLGRAIFYSGSLIQKTRGESIRHGAMRYVWAPGAVGGGAFVPEFRQFRLKRAFLTVTADRNKVTRPDAQWFVEPRFVQLWHQNCSPSFVATCCAKVRDTYGRLDDVRDFTVRRRLTLPAPQGEAVTAPIDSYEGRLQSFLRLPTQLELLREVLGSDPLAPQVLALHADRSRAVEARAVKPWRLDTLQWKNVFCYAEDNYIDFRQLRGIVSLIGRNGIGKSTIIDALFYVLYGEKIRGVGINITRKDAMSFQIVAEITVYEGEAARAADRDGTRYRVDRRGTVSGRNTDLRLFRLRPGEEQYEELSEPDTTATVKLLGAIIGNSTDLERNNIALQDHPLYVSKNYHELKSQFIRYLGLDSLAQIALEIKAELAALRRQLRELQPPKSTVGAAASEAELGRMITEATATLRWAATTGPDLEALMQRLQTQKESLLLRLHKEVETIPTLEAELATLPATEPIEPLRAEVTSAQARIAQLYREAWHTITTRGEPEQLSGMSLPELRAARATLPVVVLPGYKSGSRPSSKRGSAELAPASDLRGDWRRVRDERLGVQRTTQLYALQSAADLLQFADKCACCAANRALLAAPTSAEEKRKLRALQEQEAALLEQEILWLEAEQQRAVNAATEAEVLRLREVSAALRTRVAAQERRATVETELERLRGLRAANAEIATQIAGLKRDLAEAQGELAQLRAAAARTTTEREALRTELQFRRRHAELQEGIAVYALYQKCIDEKSGIPYELSKRYMSALEVEINDTLLQLTNYRVRLTSDPGLDLQVRFDGDSRWLPALQLSGSQKFVLDLALRITLVQSHPYLPCFLIVDEGFGCMDAAHLQSTCDFLETLGVRLAERRIWMLIVSHIDELHLLSSTQLQITRDDYGHSHLQYPLGAEWPTVEPVIVPRPDNPWLAAACMELRVTDDGSFWYCPVCEKQYVWGENVPARHVLTDMHRRRAMRK